MKQLRREKASQTTAVDQAIVALREFAVSIYSGREWNSEWSSYRLQGHTADTVGHFQSVLLTSSPDPEHPVSRSKVYLLKLAENLPFAGEGKV